MVVHRQSDNICENVCIHKIGLKAVKQYNQVTRPQLAGEVQGSFRKLEIKSLSIPPERRTVLDDK
jgi:hypothetical protein